jgi:hypothetical protein
MLFCLLPVETLLPGQNVLNFPHQAPTLTNGWYLDTDSQVRNPALPNPLPPGQSHIAAGPNARGETDYNEFSVDLNVDPAEVSGGARAYSLNNTWDEPLYQDVDFVTYVFRFNANNTEGYTNPQAGGGCSLSGKIRAQVTIGGGYQEGAARVAAGQRVTLAIGSATVTAQDQKACAVSTSTSTWGASINVSIFSLSIAVPVSTDAPLKEERVLGDSSSYLAELATTVASVSFRSEAEVQVRSSGFFLANVPGRGVLASAQAESKAKASLSLVAERNACVCDQEVIIGDDEEEGEGEG